MFSMNLRLSLISALFIPIVGLSSGVFYRKISGRFQAADEAEGDLTTCAQENLTADLFAWTAAIVLISAAFEKLFLLLVDKIAERMGA